MKERNRRVVLSSNIYIGIAKNQSECLKIKCTIEKNEDSNFAS